MVCFVWFRLSLMWQRVLPSLFVYAMLVYALIVGQRSRNHPYAQTHATCDRICVDDRRRMTKENKTKYENQLNAFENGCWFMNWKLIYQRRQILSQITLVRFTMCSMVLHSNRTNKTRPNNFIWMSIGRAKHARARHLWLTNTNWWPLWMSWSCVAHSPQRFIIYCYEI